MYNEWRISQHPVRVESNRSELDLVGRRVGFEPIIYQNLPLSRGRSQDSAPTTKHLSLVGRDSLLSYQARHVRNYVSARDQASACHPRAHRAEGAELVFSSVYKYRIY